MPLSDTIKYPVEYVYEDFLGTFYIESYTSLFLYIGVEWSDGMPNTICTLY